MSDVVHLDRGLYPARRASALAGVPRTTIDYWARNDIVVPTGSSLPRTRLWTWGDLLLLRIVQWLRETKPEAKASTMQEVRHLLQQHTSQGMTPDELAAMVAVTRKGRVVLDFADESRLVRPQQHLLGDVLPVVARFGNAGPNLLYPAPGIRMVPGKLSGEPHVEGTRIATAGLAALGERGFTTDQILDMYPELGQGDLQRSLELERQLKAA